jgi:signal transduction histidine kinase
MLGEEAERWREWTHHSIKGIAGGQSPADERDTRFSTSSWSASSCEPHVPDELEPDAARALVGAHAELEKCSVTLSQMSQADVVHGSDAVSLVSQIWLRLCATPTGAESGHAALHWAQPGGRWWDISATLSNDRRYLITIARDATDRLRLQQSETDLLAQKLCRQKDAEANAFTRHEVKNCVLEALSQCDFLHELLDGLRDGNANTAPGSGQAGGSGGGGEVEGKAATLARAVNELEDNLKRTLNTVLAEAMARELVHGEYRAQPKKQVDVVALLRSCIGAGSSGDQCKHQDSRYRLETCPSPFPLLEVDPQLVYHVFRNAISNARKYGHETEPITTRFDFESGFVRIRVLNAPGPHHERLCAMHGSEAAIFEKGKQLHVQLESASGTSLAGASVSSGDGAWIMKQCSEALGGSCSIQFAEEQTTFELRFPAQLSIDLVLSFALPADTVAIGIDDSKVQRTILRKMFEVVGVAAERRNIIGETTHSIIIARGKNSPPGEIWGWK